MKFGGEMFGAKKENTNENKIGRMEMIKDKVKKFIKVFVMVGLLGGAGEGMAQSQENQGTPENLKDKIGTIEMGMKEHGHPFITNGSNNEAVASIFEFGNQESSTQVIKGETYYIISRTNQVIQGNDTTYNTVIFADEHPQGDTLNGGVIEKGQEYMNHPLEEGIYGIGKVSNVAVVSLKSFEEVQKINKDIKEVIIENQPSNANLNNKVMEPSNSDLPAFGASNLVAGLDKKGTVKKGDFLVGTWGGENLMETGKYSDNGQASQFMIDHFLRDSGISDEDINEVNSAYQNELGEVASEFDKIDKEIADKKIAEEEKKKAEEEKIKQEKINRVDGLIDKITK